MRLQKPIVAVQVCSVVNCSWTKVELKVDRLYFVVDKAM